MCTKYLSIIYKTTQLILFFFLNSALHVLIYVPVLGSSCPVRNWIVAFTKKEKKIKKLARQWSRGPCHPIRLYFMFVKILVLLYLPHPNQNLFLATPVWHKNIILACKYATNTPTHVNYTQRSYIYAYHMLDSARVCF